eukprot:NODE_463_length_7125_cov_0.998292.p3 type:complete len:389 gc:universal NODE_463_length_7125_cov_0.998292:4246-3080(-)
MIIPTMYKDMIGNAFVFMKSHPEYSHYIGDAIVYNELDWKIALYNDPKLKELEIKRLEGFILERGAIHYVKTGFKSFFSTYCHFYCKIIKSIENYDNISFELAKLRWQNKIKKSIEKRKPIDTSNTVQTDDDEAKPSMNTLKVPIPRIDSTLNPTNEKPSDELDHQTNKLNKRKDTNHKFTTSISQMKSVPITSNASNPKLFFKLVIDSIAELREWSPNMTIAHLNLKLTPKSMILNMKHVHDQATPISPNSCLYILVKDYTISPVEVQIDKLKHDLFVPIEFRIDDILPIFVTEQPADFVIFVNKKQWITGAQPNTVKSIQITANMTKKAVKTMNYYWLNLYLIFRLNILFYLPGDLMHRFIKSLPTIVGIICIVNMFKAFGMKIKF